MKKIESLRNEIASRTGALRYGFIESGASVPPPDHADGSNEAPASDIRVTVSLGVSSLTSRTDTLADMLARADQALYRAKQSGRNCVCWTT